MPARLSRFCSIVVLLTLFRAKPASAQIDHSNPDNVARALFRADSMRDWRSLLNLIHPAALIEFRTDQAGNFGSGNRAMAMLPGLPACIQQQIERNDRLMLDSVYRVRNGDEILAMPAESVFARHYRFMQREPARRPGREIIDSLPRPVRTYLGHIIANDSTAYGITVDTWSRVPMPNWPREQARIMTFRRFGSGWRSMLDVGFMAAVMAYISDDSPDC